MNVATSNLRFTTPPRPEIKNNTSGISSQEDETKKREVVEKESNPTKRFFMKIDAYLEDKAIRQVEKATNPEIEAKMLIARHTTGAVSMLAVAANSIDNPIAFAVSAGNAVDLAIKTYYANRALKKWRNDTEEENEEIKNSSEEESAEKLSPTQKLKNFIGKMDKYLIKKGSEKFEDTYYPEVEANIETGKKFAKAVSLLYVAASSINNPTAAVITAIGAGAEAAKGYYINRASKKLTERNKKDGIETISN